MKILICSTPRSRSSIFIDYLIKEHNLYNFSEKLHLSHELASQVNINLLKKQSRQEYFQKTFDSQMSTLLSYDNVVAKLWGTMLYYNDNQNLVFHTAISKIIPFDRFDTIYCIERDIYDVAASWFYKSSGQQKSITFDYSYKPLVYKAVIDVLVLERIIDFLKRKNHDYISLSYNDISNIISKYKFDRKPNNVIYQESILNYDDLIECIDQCKKELLFVRDLKFC